MSDTLDTGLCMDNFQWDDDVRYRFENTANGHFKFYEILLEEVFDAPGAVRTLPEHFILRTSYGSMKPGAHVTHRAEGFATRREAEEKMSKNIRTRLDHGYREVSQ